MVDIDLEQRIAALPPARRALFEQLAAQQQRPVTHELSWMQRGLWFIERLLPASPLYTTAWRLRIRGPLDPAALTRALSRVVDRHEALRTSFGMRDGQPRQIVHPRVDVAIPYDDLRACADQERDAALAAITARELASGFDLGRAPLLRARLGQLSDDAHVLLLCVHHIVFDAASTGILLDELCASYDDAAALPAPTLQYGDFVAWQRRRLQGQRLDELLSFWRRTLDGAPGLLDVPGDRTRPARQSFKGAAHRLELSSDATRAMARLAASRRCTLFMAYLAVFQLLLARYTGRTDISVGTPAANRGRSEFASLVGFCVNMVVMRTDLSGDPTFREVLDRVRATCLGAYEHEELPFDHLVEALAPNRGLSHNPLFQVACVLDPAPGVGGRLGAATIEGVDGLHPGLAKFDISFAGVVRDDGIVVTVDYSTELFDAASIARLAGHFARLWDAAIAHPDQPVSTLPMLLPDDVPTAGEQPAVATPAAHEVVASHAARSPSSPALVTDSGDVSYAELADRVRRFADAAPVPTGPVDVGGDDIERIVAALAAAGSAERLEPSPVASAALVADALRLTAADRVAVVGMAAPYRLVAALAALHAGATCRLSSAADPVAAATASWRPTVLWAGSHAVAALRADGSDALAHARCVVTDPSRLPPRLPASVSLAVAYIVAPGQLAAVRIVDAVTGDDAAGLEPVPGVALVLTDDAGRPVPVNVPGDVRVAGPSDRSPAAHAVGASTGDRMRRRADGRLEYLCRRAELVDVDGGLVVPRVVEDAALACPWVQDAVLVDQEGLVLYVTGTPDRADAALRDLQALLAERLPHYMLPRSVLTVDAIPLLDDGAVDVDNLRGRAADTVQLKQPYAAPRDAFERIVVMVWEQLLDKPQVGVHDNFFDLGGHSLLAVQLLSTLGDMFGAELPISVLFGASTPATLCGQLTSALGGAETATRLAESVEAILALPEEEVQRRLEEAPTP